MRCNEHLVKMLGEDPIEVDARGPGTCAVVCFVQGRELWVAGVGDCRAVWAARRPTARCWRSR